MKGHNHLVIFVFLCGVYCDGLDLRRGRRRNRHDYRSPLDEGEDLNALGQFGTEILVPDQVAMDKLPECQKACNDAFSNAMKIALQAPNHHERFVGVCMHFNESISCHDKLEDCPGREAFDVMTSGLYYACIDQRRAFDNVIECLDIKSNEVQTECETKCRGQTRLSDWVSKAGLFNVFSRSEQVAQPFELDNFRLMIHDVCELATCYLSCIRNAYDTKCGENAGTLLSATIVRPVAETQTDPFVKTMSTLLYVFVPQQCSMFVREENLAEHRIDPAIDHQLRQRAEEERLQEMQNSTTENVANEQPQANNTVQLIQSQATKHVQPQLELMEQKSEPELQNDTAIVGDMSNFDPIDLGEKYGLDIGEI
ncbi:hypothetical protein M3Y97_00479000 [Aphelenchoides bicaudatus]|nr:hypothetical protein M3Y97_00479000 [Aphelenchoides bicaudatus]